MPSSVGSAALALAVVIAITGLAPVVAIIVAVLALIWEGVLFYIAGAAA